MAGLNLVDGKVTALVGQSNENPDFVDFSRPLDSKFEPNFKIRVAPDNQPHDASKETGKYLETRPGRFVFAPKRGPWLNLVEHFFYKLTCSYFENIKINSKE